MWTGMLSAAAAQVWIVPAELLNALNGFFLAYVAAVARWGARLPGAVAEVGIDGPLQLAIAYAALAGTLWRGMAVARRSLAGGPRWLGACALVAVAGCALLLRGHAPRATLALHRHVPRRRAGRRDPDPGAGRPRGARGRRPAGGGRGVEAARPRRDAARRGGAHACPGGPPGWSRGRADAASRSTSCSTAATPPTGPTTGASWRSPAPAAVACRARRGRPALQARALRCGSTCWLPDRRSTPRTASTRICAPRCSTSPIAGSTCCCRRTPRARSPRGSPCAGSRC